MLIRKLNHLNHDLETFFESVKSDDSSILFTGKKEYSPFIKLYQKLEEINGNFQRVKMENYRQGEYFRVLVEHINVGVISFTEEGKITLYNRSAKELFQQPHLSTIDELDVIQTGLSVTIKEMQPTEQKLATLYRGNDLLQLAIRSTWIKFQDTQIKLVSFQNIRNELDEKELESWQKLIRVLTHELMNSVGPINSTIVTISEFLTDSQGRSKPVKDLSDTIVEDTVQGIKIIEERSQGMMNFVSKFRSLTLFPTPTFTTFPAGDLLKGIERLMTEQLIKQEIKLGISIIPGNMVLTADKGMMEQILINLVSNAIVALQGEVNKKINIEAYTDGNKRPMIRVIDNGIGIPPEIQDKIFIPFFTTRKEGTGVGLSLSRQLARLQGGTLTFFSKQGEGTSFTIRL